MSPFVSEAEGIVRNWVYLAYGDIGAWPTSYFMLCALIDIALAKKDAEKAKLVKQWQEAVTVHRGC